LWSWRYQRGYAIDWQRGCRLATRHDWSWCATASRVSPVQLPHGEIRDQRASCTLAPSITDAIPHCSCPVWRPSAASSTSDPTSCAWISLAHVDPSEPYLWRQKSRPWGSPTSCASTTGFHTTQRKPSSQTRTCCCCWLNSNQTRFQTNCT